jgi:stearoyl-CoA desaturase (delta-9 desaturase)
LNLNSATPQAPLIAARAPASEAVEHDHELHHGHEHHHHSHGVLTPITRTTRLINVLAVTLPFVGFLATIAYFWGWGFDWVQLGIFLVMFCGTGIGVTVGFHRYFTHKSFETYRPIQFMLAVLGSMAVEGPVIKWVADHRRHHQHSDDDFDPHSPHVHGDTVLSTLRGFWHAHTGWLFQPHPKNFSRYVKDLLQDRMVRNVSQMFVFWVVMSLLIPTVLGGLLTLSWHGALLGFLWGGLARIFLVHHITWSINSVCHIWGAQPFRSHDHSRNNVIFGFLAFGEGWHNTHHAFPTSARHGLFWWQLDISYLFIRTLQFLGLAWQIRLPKPEQIEAKLNHIPAPPAPESQTPAPIMQSTELPA